MNLFHTEKVCSVCNILHLCAVVMITYRIVKQRWTSFSCNSMKISISFSKNEGIVGSTHLSRVESSANGMTNLAVAVVIITATTMLAANLHVRLQEDQHSQSIKIKIYSRTKSCLQPAMILS